MAEVKLNDNAKISTAKTFTELAIQNGLIMQHGTNKETAEEIALFFETIIQTLK